MKPYPEISGPSNAPHVPCISFWKYDGRAIRCEWSRKRGFNKFGSRNVLLDKSHEFLGSAIDIFLNKYSQKLENIFKKEKLFGGVEIITCYSEFFGPNSFAGIHDPNDAKDVVLFDINLHKKGFLHPREFVNTFKNTEIDVAKVVYEGNFNKTLIDNVIAGKIGSKEGVVCKGSMPGKHPQHSLWFAKIKTKWWMDELKNRMSTNPEFRKVFEDNLKEQQL